MAKAILHNKPQKHCVVCLFVIDPFLERPLAEGTGDTKTEQKTQKPKTQAQQKTENSTIALQNTKSKPESMLER
jgi:hypothetical protein